MFRHRRARVLIALGVVLVLIGAGVSWVAGSALASSHVRVITGMAPVCDDPVSYAPQPERDGAISWPTLRVDSRLRCRVAVVVRNDGPVPVTVEEVRWPLLAGPPVTDAPVRARSHAPLNWVLKRPSPDDDDVDARLVAQGGEPLPRGGQVAVWTWMIPVESGCLQPDATFMLSDAPFVVVSVLGRRHTIRGAGPVIAFKGTSESAHGCAD